MKSKKLPELWQEPQSVTSLLDPEEEEEEEEEDEEEEKVQERSPRRVRDFPRVVVLGDHGILVVLMDQSILVVPGDHSILALSQLSTASSAIPLCSPLSPLSVTAVAAGDQTSAGGSWMELGGLPGQVLWGQ